jgi:hypothetical protein
VRIFVLIALILSVKAEEKNLYRLNSDAGFSFFAERDNSTARDFLKTVNILSKNLEKSLGKNPQKAQVRFFLNKKSENKNSLYRFFITYQDLESTESTELTFRIQEQLLKGYFNQEKIPAWLNASLIHNTKFKNEEFFHLQKRFVFSRKFSDLGLKYNLDFLNQKLDFNYLPIMQKQVFIERSKILQRLIFKSKKLKDTFKSDLSEGKYSQKNISKYLSKESSNKTIFDVWINQESQKIIYNSIYAIKGPQVVKRLDKLSELTVSKKNALGQYYLEKLPLEELGNYKPSTNNNYLMSITLNFTRLYNKSPFYLKEKLIKIQKAISEFASGKTSQFKKKILSIKEGLNKAVELEQKRLDWFKKQELKFLRSSQIYPEVIQVYDRKIIERSKILEKEFEWFKTIEARLNN